MQKVPQGDHQAIAKTRPLMTVRAHAPTIVRAYAFSGARLRDTSGFRRVSWERCARQRRAGRAVAPVPSGTGSAPEDPMANDCGHLDLLHADNGILR